MIILITGASHTGKTALAQKLLKKYKYPYLSIDHLKMGLIRSGNTELTPMSDTNELTEYLWPIVREMVKTAIENEQNLIVEGCYIPFTWKQDFERSYLKHIKYYCLVMSENYIQNHFKDIKEYANVVEHRLEDECTLESLIMDNKQMLELAQKHELNYILIENEYEINLQEHCNSQPGAELLQGMIGAEKMKKVLVTGGTVFVSRYIAEYYVAKGYDVYVLNRNTKEQSKGVTLIQADRHNIGDALKEIYFDVVVDTAYSSYDVVTLLDALGEYGDYILISSSAVYPEDAPQPFAEGTNLAVNKYWGMYGTNKIEAEAVLQERNTKAYILRPPYLYGPMNNVYREAFVFDCALNDRTFYLPKDGSMKLQFFHIHDLCRFMDVILEKKPQQHIYNVGNKEAISIREWVKLCYEAVGKEVNFVEVQEEIEQRNYFCFNNYEYYLDVSKQYELMSDIKPIKDGLKESLNWYLNNIDKVYKKPYMDFIDRNLNK